LREEEEPGVVEGVEGAGGAEGEDSEALGGAVVAIAGGRRKRSQSKEKEVALHV